MNIQYCSLSYDDIYTKLYQNAHEGAYISYIRGRRCQTDEAFFYEVSASFQFPPYFGENWNAFDDCIQDLDWLSFSKIFIVIDDFSLAYKNDDEGRNLLLRHLKYMIDYWSQNKVDVKVLLNN